MNILYLTIDRSNMVVSHFENWQKGLSKEVDVTFIKKPIHPYKTGQFLRETVTGQIPYQKVLLSHLTNIDNKYDWIITDSSMAYWNEDWDEIKIPKAMIIEDAWGANIELELQKAVQAKYDILFYKTKEAFHKLQKKYLDIFDCRWLPHSVNLDMFKDYGLEKTRDAIVTGALNPVFYPVRYNMTQTLKDEDYFEIIPRPRDDGIKPGWPVNEDYAKVLNESKIVYACGAKHNCLYMKHLEVQACRSLLISNYYSDLEEQGFKHNENMIVADMKNLKKQARKLLVDDGFIEEITNNGYNFVRKNHSCEVRVKQLLGELNG